MGLGRVVFPSEKTFQEPLKTAIIPVWRLRRCHTAMATNERYSSVDGSGKRQQASFAKKLMKTIATRLLAVNMSP